MQPSYSHKRVLVGLLVSAIAALALILAATSSGAAPQPGPALAHTACPIAGQCGMNPKTGCPTDGPLQATPPEHCVPIPSSLPIVSVPGGNAGCDEYVQVQLEPGIDEYEAVWYGTIGLGTRWWSSPGTEWPGSVLGIGASYSVPKGYAAWSAGYGSSCPPPDTYGTAAWGIPSCGASATSAAARGAAAACCIARPRITGRATRDPLTGDVSVDLSASRLGRMSTCGRAKMSITDPGHGTLYLRVNQHGSTATAHRDLVGSEQCVDLTRATVSVPKGGTAHRDVQVPNSIIRIASSTAHRTPQGTISLTVVANHLLPACGRRDFSWQSFDGTDTLTITRSRGSTATAKRTLPAGQDCAPDGTILVVQPRDPWSHAQRNVLAPAPFPTVCKAPAP